jgi:hypothetical protein
MPTIPPGLRNGPPDPRAPRPTPRNTSHGPSCLCPCRCALTAPAVAARRSGQRSPNQVARPYPHDARCLVLYAAITRRGKNADHAPHGFSSLDGQTGASGNSCPRVRCAAPPPRLHLTGERVTFILSFDEDGTRRRIWFSVAANRRLGFCTRHGNGERTSRSVWCRQGGAPACDITSGHATDCQRCQHHQGGKKAKNRSEDIFVS